LGGLGTAEEKAPETAKDRLQTPGARPAGGLKAWRGGTVMVEHRRTFHVLAGRVRCESNPRQPVVLCGAM